MKTFDPTEQDYQAVQDRLKKAVKASFTADDVLNSPELMAKYLPYIQPALDVPFDASYSENTILKLLGIDLSKWDEFPVYFSFNVKPDGKEIELTITTYHATHELENDLENWFNWFDWESAELTMSITTVNYPQQRKLIQLRLASAVASYLNNLPTYEKHIKRLEALQRENKAQEQARQEALRTNTIKTLIQPISAYNIEAQDTQLSQPLAQGWDVLNITIRTFGTGEDELTQRIVTLKRSPVVANIQAQVEDAVTILNSLPFLSNVTSETLLPAVKKLANEWQTCTTGYAPKQTAFDNNNVHMIGGRLDAGAFHRAIMVARDLLKAGKWDCTSQLWVCDPYAMYNRVERDINTAVMREVNGDWYTSYSADALELILKRVMQNA